MNPIKELERLTMPAGASKARRLSAEEIKQLVTGGEITPINLVHRASELPRVHVPGNSCRGSYDR